MMANLLEHLQKNNAEACIKILTNKAFVMYLCVQDCIRLMKLVEANINNVSYLNTSQSYQNVQKQPSSYHPKVVLNIYCIGIMKGVTQYNTKIAIDFLCRYYKSLEASLKANPDLCESILRKRLMNMKNIANLLLRIPTFSNYKLIIKDITPELSPLWLVLDHRDKMKKQCPNLYQQYIVKRYCHIWPQLVTVPPMQATKQTDKQSYKFVQGQLHANSAIVINSTENNHSLSAQLHNYLIDPLQQFDKILKEDGNPHNSAQDQINLKLCQIQLQICKNLVYLKKRIKGIIKEEIEIEKVYSSLMEVLNYNLVSLQIRSEAVANLYKSAVKKLKNGVIDILAQLVCKLKYMLMRKLANIVTVLSNKLMNYHAEYETLDLVPIIRLLGAIIRQLGTGYASFIKFLFNSEYSLLGLIKSLCLNPHSPPLNNQSDKQMNYQSNKKNNKNNKMTYLSMKPSAIETPFQSYISENYVRRQQIMFEALQLFIIYFQRLKKTTHTNNYPCQNYSTDSDSGQDYGYASQLISVLENSKNDLNQLNKQKLKQLINVLFRHAGNAVEEQFWDFCARSFHNLIVQRTKKRQLTYQKSIDVLIQPSMTKKVKKQKLIQSQPAEKVSNDKILDLNRNQIRKTQSFDQVLQGWSSENKKPQKFSSLNESVANKSSSEMFYSIREYSEDIQNNDNKMQEQESDQEFILTPDFS